ncbi:MAG: YdcF family protein [Pseudobdellovibrionaceae bacterium]
MKLNVLPTSRLIYQKKRIWISLTFVSLVVFLYVREYRKIAREPINSWTQVQTADCGIVLTGAAGRVREGFDLLSRKEIQKLIISGVHPEATLREIMPLWPFYGKLSEKDVILDRHSTTTFGNAVQAFPLVEALHCRDVVLITSQLHMYRSKKTFQAVFPSDFMIQTRSTVSGGRYRPSLWDMFVEISKSLFYSAWAY